MSTGTNILGDLVLELTQEGRERRLDTDEQQRFYREFADEIADETDQNREFKRRSYEQIKDLALR